MNNDKIVLKDGTEVALHSSQGLGALRVFAGDIEEACLRWKGFTKENLKKVLVKNAEGLTVGDYSDLVLDHISAEEAMGGILVTFSLRNKTAEEITNERMLAIEASQQTQDAAISDLGQTVSDMAEGSMQ